jgi:hypothetical protein
MINIGDLSTRMKLDREAMGLLSGGWRRSSGVPILKPTMEPGPPPPFVPIPYPNIPKSQPKYSLSIWRF